MPNAHGDLPATHADVHALEQKIEGRLQRLEEKMDGRFVDVDRRFGEMEGRVILALKQSQLEILERTQEMVRDAQTELLRGFASFAESQQIRMSKMTADISNIDASTNLRMIVLERRLLEIEKRLHIPPPPRAGETN
jgi:hypothetical protein